MTTTASIATASPAPVRLVRAGTVAVIEIDNPPVNAASQAVRAGIVASLAEANADAAVAAVVLAAAGRTFVAGADIREFDGPLLAPFLPDVCSMIEASAKPVVAALQGSALGGGCELALAAHARVMADDAVLGLPEVKLGLIPGAGGTQRLPRLVDVATAFDIAVTGREVKAVEAARLGLVDEIVPLADLRAAAIARAAAPAGKELRHTLSKPVLATDRAAFDAAKGKAIARARGQTAPAAVAAAMTAALDGDAAAGLATERKLFLELRGSDQARAMRHIFFAERQAGRPPELKGIKAATVQRIGVVGAGTMGAGISGACLRGGYAVTLVEPNEGVRAKAAERIGAILAKSGGEAAMATLQIEADTSRLSGCDLVIEAVFEDFDVKARLLADLARIVPPGAVIATNTSYLDVDKLAEATGRAQDVIGLHFFAPPEIMRLVEVVRGEASAPLALATGLTVARKLGKLPVVVSVCDGFVGNRILSIYRRAMECLLEDGALPEEIDAALEAYGLAMGPFAVSDLSGLDIAWARRKRLAATRNPHERYVTVADTLCEMGRLGRKTNAGWYAYDDGKRKPDPIVGEVISKARAAKGIMARRVSTEEIQARARAAIVNEAAKILEEGVAASPADIDLVLVNGYGYPIWRGGPLHDADRAGLKAVLADVERLHADNGIGFEPAALLRNLAGRGASFADWSAARSGGAA